jgi:hypothetical protein
MTHSARRQWGTDQFSCRVGPRKRVIDRTRSIPPSGEEHKANLPGTPPSHIQSSSKARVAGGPDLPHYKILVGG